MLLTQLNNLLVSAASCTTYIYGFRFKALLCSIHFMSPMLAIGSDF